MKEDKDSRRDASLESVIVEKLFGPTVFMDLRITPDRNSCHWVIERRTILPCPDPSDPEFTTQNPVWVEWCRIPGQFPWEFEGD